MIEHSTELDNLPDALLAAQLEMGAAVKTALNPHFKSKYANLETLIATVKEPLLKNGIVLTQHPISEILPATDKAPALALVGCETMLLHTSGEYIKSRLLLPCEGLTPQKAGSAITYAKRYTVEAINLIPSVDDDGNDASVPVAKATAVTDNTTIDLLAEIQQITDVKSLNAFYKSQIEPVAFRESVKMTIMKALTKRREEIEKGSK